MSTGSSADVKMARHALFFKERLRDKRKEQLPLKRSVRSLGRKPVHGRQKGAYRQKWSPFAVF